MLSDYSWQLEKQLLRCRHKVIARFYEKKSRMTSNELENRLQKNFGHKSAKQWSFNKIKKWKSELERDLQIKRNRHSFGLEIEEL